MKNTIHKFTPEQQEIIWDLKQKHLDYMDHHYGRPDQMKRFVDFVRRYHPAHTELAYQCKGVKLLKWTPVKQPA